jgi:hypothetical protein
MAFLLCSCAFRQTSYLHLTKSQLVSRLGLPATIALYEHKPSVEYWCYYQRSGSGGVDAKYFSFGDYNSLGHVTDCAADVRPDRFLSTNNPADLRKIQALHAEMRRRDPTLQ